MTLKYALKEGFIDVRFWPDDEVSGSRRIEIRVNLAGARIANTNLGNAIIQESTGEMILLDKQSVDLYGVAVETVVNLNIFNAIQALNL